MITPEVKPGVTTEYLNKLCHDFIEARGAIPAPLNYRGFPQSICTSVNHVVCHGIPSDDTRPANADIIHLDVTLIVDGWHGDTSHMFFVGEPKIIARRLVEVTDETMMHGHDVGKPGAKQ